MIRKRFCLVGAVLLCVFLVATGLVAQDNNAVVTLSPDSFTLKDKCSLKDGGINIGTYGSATRADIFKHISEIRLKASTTFDERGVYCKLKYDDGAQLRTIRPVTPYPGSPLYYHAIENGLLKDVEDFYENKHLNSDLLAVNFTELCDGEFHEALFEANERLLNNYFEKKKQTNIEAAKKLYLQNDVSFRGFRQS